MSQQPSAFPVQNFILFLVLSFAILIGYTALTSRLNPPKPRPPKQPPAGEVAAEPQDPDEDAQPGAEEPPAGPGEDEPEPAADQPPEPQGPEIVAPQRRFPQTWVSLGSADPADPYRMLVTLTNEGAAVTRIELNGSRFHELDDRSGYLGHVVLDDDVGGSGCPVQMVGPGTPAAKAGLKRGDLIKALDDTRITGSQALRKALAATRPRRTVKLKVARSGKELIIPVRLGNRPLQLIRPEASDPLSFLLTLNQLDKRKLSAPKDKVDPGKELAGLDLWTGHWEVISADRTQASFRRLLPKSGLEITKTYRLAKVPQEAKDDPTCRAYHLELEIGIRNAGGLARTVAYQLDGPTGLPTEGAWYANKVSRSWGGAGLRDVVVSFEKRTPSMINCPDIAEGDVENPWEDESLTYLGIDAQYFSVVLIPDKKDDAEVWFARSHPLRVGEVDKKRPRLTNTSCRMISNPHALAPGAALTHRFVVFAGPKKPDLLAHYDLDELVYYGWPVFAWFAVPLVKTLHFFYAIVHNYGLAIILLTVLVRGCMFPISRKQALGAQKMQQLQPEIKKLQEKYKKDMEARTKAQQELFRKHNYNPLSGCLVIFIQLPIFVGLYKGLMVDVELRQAPLISEKIRWCFNLSAPDMLFDWSWLMPEWFSEGVGIFALGPYFNLLPVLTIVLFILQQKMFMPPPADEQAAMQQKMMKFMMIFMGLLFFKVASGLCIYFIASSLWGLAERKLLPKTSAATPDAKPASKPPEKPRPKPQPRPAPKQVAAGRDGDAAPKKKKKSKRGKR